MPRRSLTQLYREEFRGYTAGKFRQDVLAGLTVGAVALPLALAFGVASGATAAAGLVTAILAGVIIGALSGAPYQISGPTGAMSAVLIVLAQRYGLTGIWVAGALSGVLLLIIGLLRLGRFIAFIPAPVITGFTSGIALIIAIGQIDNFLGAKTPGVDSAALKLIGYFRGGFTLDGHAVVLGLIVILAMVFWPKKWNALPSLAARHPPGHRTECRGELAGARDWGDPANLAPERPPDVRGDPVEHAGRVRRPDPDDCSAGRGGEPAVRRGGQ